ncbi:MAG: hypothetical protein ACOC1K_04640 [Nanoarchaeota archaeon]
MILCDYGVAGNGKTSRQNNIIIKLGEKFGQTKTPYFVRIAYTNVNLNDNKLATQQIYKGSLYVKFVIDDFTIDTFLSSFIGEKESFLCSEDVEKVKNVNSYNDIINIDNNDFLQYNYCSWLIENHKQGFSLFNKQKESFRQVDLLIIDEAQDIKYYHLVIILLMYYSGIIKNILFSGEYWQTIHTGFKETNEVITPVVDNSFENINKYYRIVSCPLLLDEIKESVSDMIEYAPDLNIENLYRFKMLNYDYETKRLPNEFVDSVNKNTSFLTSIFEKTVIDYWKKFKTSYSFPDFNIAVKGCSIYNEMLSKVSVFFSASNLIQISDSEIKRISEEINKNLITLFHPAFYYSNCIFLLGKFAYESNKKISEIVDINKRTHQNSSFYVSNFLEKLNFDLSKSVIDNYLFNSNNLPDYFSESIEILYNHNNKIENNQHRDKIDWDIVRKNTLADLFICQLKFYKDWLVFVKENDNNNTYEFRYNLMFDNVEKILSQDKEHIGNILNNKMGITESSNLDNIFKMSVNIDSYFDLIGDESKHCVFTTTYKSKGITTDRIVGVYSGEKNKKNKNALRNVSGTRSRSGIVII